jgi:hypothetical protein
MSAGHTVIVKADVTDVKPRSLVNRYQNFGGNYIFHRQDWKAQS